MTEEELRAICKGCRERYPDGDCRGCPNYADVELVHHEHGRWIVGEMYVFGCPIHCSECGWGSDRADVNKWMNYPGHKFCGSCGAKMDGGEEE